MGVRVGARAGARVRVRGCLLFREYSTSMGIFGWRVRNGVRVRIGVTRCVRIGVRVRIGVAS